MTELAFDAELYVNAVADLDSSRLEETSYYRPIGRRSREKEKI